MTRTRLSTTVDAELLARARQLSGAKDAALVDEALAALVARLCVNVAERANFDDSILERASVFVPRVGPLTIAMATRNLTRLTQMGLHGTAG